MSISQEISRIKSSKKDIKNSISKKGVSVPNEAKINELSQLIDLITTEVQAGETTTLSSDQKAKVSLRKEGNNNYLDFAIPQGYTPKRGIDYYTKKDIEDLIDKISTKWNDLY